jgi:hypothetical protein
MLSDGRMVQVTARVAVWSGRTKTDRALGRLDNETLARTLRKIAGAGSACLTLEAGPEISLIVGASQGAYCATAVLGDDEFYDLIGDPAATGEVEFGLGGQRVPYPRRLLVSLEQALSAAVEFAATGTVDTSTARWVRNGDEPA